MLGFPSAVRIRYRVRTSLAFWSKRVSGNWPLTLWSGCQSITNPFPTSCPEQQTRIMSQFALMNFSTCKGIFSALYSHWTPNGMNYQMIDHGSVAAVVFIVQHQIRVFLQVLFNLVHIFIPVPVTSNDSDTERLCQRSEKHDGGWRKGVQ